MYKSCEIAPYEKIVGISYTTIIYDNCKTIGKITLKFSNGREERFSGRRYNEFPNKKNVELKAPEGQYIYSFNGYVDKKYLSELSIKETKPL